MTLLDNVTISDKRRAMEEAESAASVVDLCSQVQLEISKEQYPLGVETMLAREFGGTDLSGGEWQRIAIARGLYRHHDIIVLDEPTASIDPLEESRIYRQFMEITRGKTAILVTHRIGSARIANRIVVLSGGRIAEVGTHSQLVARGGLYAQMYQAQAKWYEQASQEASAT